MEPVTAVKLSVSMTRHRGSSDIKFIHISSFITNVDSCSTPSDTLIFYVYLTACGNADSIRVTAFAQRLLEPTGTALSADSIQFAKPTSFQYLASYARLPAASGAYGVRQMHDQKCDS